MDEQVSVTHLHGSRRKNKRERVEIYTKERNDVFFWIQKVMQLASSLTTLPESSKHASPADSAIWKEERIGGSFTNTSGS